MSFMYAYVNLGTDIKFVNYADNLRNILYFHIYN